MWHHGMTQSQHGNNEINYIDDNMMHASVWFILFGGLFNVETREKWAGNMTIRSEI